jgi:hypothetical protein
MFNAELVLYGYAQVMTIPFNIFPAVCKGVTESGQRPEIFLPS